MAFHSQYGQDRFVDRAIFQGMFGGVFVDIGAHDGVEFSNTCMFERDRRWTGLCVEPNPDTYTTLASNRRCKTLQAAIGGTNGAASFIKVSGSGMLAMHSGLVETFDARRRERLDWVVENLHGARSETSVPVLRLNDALRNAGIDEVHYLSIDTEGSELAILSSFDFDAVKVHLIEVECNYAEELQGLAGALPGFDLVGQHYQDAFFINRESPFHARLGAAKQALRGMSFDRRMGKLLGKWWPRH